MKTLELRRSRDLAKVTELAVGGWVRELGCDPGLTDFKVVGLSTRLSGSGGGRGLSTPGPCTSPKGRRKLLPVPAAPWWLLLGLCPTNPVACDQ